MVNQIYFYVMTRRHMVNYWLMKSEPHVYPWKQLVSDGSTHWDGVRNYQARNIMRDDMLLGDMVLFYHSNCKPPHIAGIARVCKEAYPDHTAQDPGSKYYDSKASADNPRWLWSILNLYQQLPQLISLNLDLMVTLRECPC